MLARVVHCLGRYRSRVACSRLSRKQVPVPGKKSVVASMRRIDIFSLTEWTTSPCSREDRTAHRSRNGAAHLLLPLSLYQEPSNGVNLLSDLSSSSLLQERERGRERSDVENPTICHALSNRKLPERSSRHLCIHHVTAKRPAPIDAVRPLSFVTTGRTCVAHTDFTHVI